MGAILAEKPATRRSNRRWALSNGVRVQAHRYDDTLYAFEITQQKQCLGTIIPKNQTEMKQLETLLDLDHSVDGFRCNDEFGTVIRLSK